MEGENNPHYRYFPEDWIPSTPFAVKKGEKI
jgi:hypothetical protein